MFKAITLSVLSLALLTGFASAQLPPGLGGTTQPAPTQPAENTLETLCNQGMAAYQARDYKKAQACFLEAFKLQPSNEGIAVMLAMCSNAAGDTDTAIAACVHVINKIKKDSPLAFREIGLAYAIKAAYARKNGDGQAQEFSKYATACLVKSIQLDNTNKAAWDYLVAHLEACGDKEGADAVRQARQQAGV